MANNKNHMKNLKPFKKWKEGWPGRPPKVLTSVLADLRKEGFKEVKPSAVLEAYEILLGLNKARLKQIAVDQTVPVIIGITALHMLTKKGNEMLERMLDRAHGRPKQTHELTGGIKISPEEQEKKKSFVQQFILWQKNKK